MQNAKRKRALGRGRIERVVENGRVTYRADYVDARGRRHRKLVAGDLPTAQRILAKLIRDRDLERAGMKSETRDPVALRPILDQYLAELAMRSGKRLVKEATSCLLRVVAELDVTTVEELSKGVIVAWRQRRSAAGSANKTTNNAVALLSAALNFGTALGHVASNPLAGLQPLPITPVHRKRKPRAFTEEEITRFLAAAERYDARFPRRVPRTPLLTFLLGTGARFSEAVATRWSDIDMERGSVTFRGENTKTQTTRTVPLHECVLAQLRSLHAHEVRVRTSPPAPDDPAFRSPESKNWTGQGRHIFGRHVNRLLRLAGIPKVDAGGGHLHVHAMRHTFATRLSRAGVSVATAQKLTGHKTTTMLLNVYTHVGTTETRRAIDSLPPLAAPAMHGAL